MIEIRNLTKIYDKSTEPVLENITVTIHEGDVIAIIGPSGAGKSTFLNAINLLDPATSGEILFDGVNLMAKDTPVEEYRKRIGMVFQSFNLFSHMTVLENVMEPQIDLLKATRQEAYDNAVEQLQLVGMAEKLFSYPHQLSGGQKQRVAIARTVAMKPEVMLLDEPTSALDPAMVAEVEYVIRKLAASGHTMLIVTHSMEFAREVANRIFYMDEKGIYEDGPTEEIFLHPQKEKTRRFLRRIKCLELLIDPRSFDYIEIIGRLEEFGDKAGIENSRIKKAELLFEEFVVENLIPSMEKAGDILMTLEKEEGSHRLIMSVSHNGEPVSEKLAPWSAKIIQGLASEVRLVENPEKRE